MAVTTTPSSNAISIRLNNGTQGGVVQTVGVSLGKLSRVAFPRDNAQTFQADAQKAYNIVNLLEYCLSKSIYGVELTQKVALSETE